MWFKQAQIFQVALPELMDEATLQMQLETYAFQPCLPTLPYTYGWDSLIDQEEKIFVYATNNIFMIHMRLEEKILPATVVRQTLNEKIKEIEQQGRKVFQKEKYALKDEITYTLLPQAFSKYTSIYAYFDRKNNWLIVDTTTPSKLEKFLKLFKKTFPDLHCSPISTEKMSPILTRWLEHDHIPAQFYIEKTAVLKDPKQAGRIIRCQQQDLQAPAIQALFKDGCEVHQVSLSWQGKIDFVLVDDFTLKNMHYSDEILALAKDQYTESVAQQWDANCIMMTELLSALWEQLMPLFETKSQQDTPVPHATLV